MRKRNLRQVACAACAALVAAGTAFAIAEEPVADPFAFLAPDIAVSMSDRRRLDRDEVIVRTLDGDDGQLAVFVATRLRATPMRWWRGRAQSQS
jgi:hypothetical protein